MRIIIALFVIGAFFRCGSAQEWVRLTDGKLAWARPAPPLIPDDAPIIMKTTGLGPMMSKLWMLNGAPIPTIGPGGPLIELLRALNGGPGLKAIRPDRPIYAGFFRPTGIDSGSGSDDLAKQLFRNALVVLPVASEQRFFRSLDARFERIDEEANAVRRYRLQADELDYEAWTRAVLEGTIDPRQVPPEGYARSGNDVLFCRGNGDFVAMTSNPTIAACLSAEQAPQSWVLMTPPKSPPSVPTSVPAAARLVPEEFLRPDSDVVVKFRLAQSDRADGRVLLEPIRALTRSLERMAGGQDAGPQTEATIKALVETLTGLLRIDFNKLKHIEASFDIRGAEFELTIRSKSGGGHDGVSAMAGTPGPLLGLVPQDAVAAGWTAGGLGAEIRNAYAELVGPISGILAIPGPPAAAAATTRDTPRAGQSVYYMEVDDDGRFSVAEWLELEQLPVDPDSVRRAIERETFLGRTLKQQAPDMSLALAGTRTLAGRKTWLFRFDPQPQTILWEYASGLEAAVARLQQHKHPVAVAHVDGRLVCVCAENPEAALKRAFQLLTTEPEVDLGPDTFERPQKIEFAGYIRAGQLQHLLLGAPESRRSPSGRQLHVVVGQTGSVRRLHVRGPASFFREFEAMTTRSREQRQRVLTQQRMLLLRRALQRQLKRGDQVSLNGLFESDSDADPVLPELYRFALEDGWGRAFKLRREASGAWSLISFGEDGNIGGETEARDLILRIP